MSKKMDRKKRGNSTFHPKKKQDFDPRASKENSLKESVDKKKNLKAHTPSKAPKRRKKQVVIRKVKMRQKRRGLLRELIYSLFLVISLLMIIQWLFFFLPKIDGYAMSGSLENGDRVVISKYSKIQRFDLVYFKKPGSNQRMVRRVIGLPGDAVSYKGEQLFINQQLVSERFLEQAITEAKQDNRVWTEDFHLTELTGVYELPENAYFLLGDNRPFSADSRQFGWILKDQLSGVVKFRLFPIHQMTQF
ncbi:signal peptidase I [Enterococcus sp. DIV0212c]|uniref:signal peptidase I n=1 Tax=Enterococcus sp. DIV0212c TaxID=2230867 RepID=UPI001A9B00CA|nr:signal peptidase I [Enterococcus sp. DIV0212c]MBO1355271.1 signal peptidase I [Enterococcus sp. DIV0212c]